MTTVRFKVHAKDPSCEFVEAHWSAPFYPQIGDTLLLPDGSADGQDVKVMDRVIGRFGDVDIWVGEFDGWPPGSVAAIFDRMLA